VISAISSGEFRTARRRLRGLLLALAIIDRPLSGLCCVNRRDVAGPAHAGAHIIRRTAWDLGAVYITGLAENWKHITPAVIVVGIAAYRQPCSEPLRYGRPLGGWLLHRLVGFNAAGVETSFRVSS